MTLGEEIGGDHLFHDVIKVDLRSSRTLEGIDEGEETLDECTVQCSVSQKEISSPMLAKLAQ